MQDIFDRNEQTKVNEWRTDNSIFKFISSNLDAEGKLVKSAQDLPDQIQDDGKLKYAPGLLDAMFGASESDEAYKRISDLSKHLKRIALHGNKISEQEFYRLVTEDEGVIGIIDNFLQTIGSEGLPIQPYLFSFAKDLMTMSDKRNAVKFGIAISGLCQNASVLKELKLLGLHDEFTVYAGIAISNLSDNASKDLWELAKKVDGWGKIQLVDRLTMLELSEPIKDWLILDGYKNEIMYAYLAYACAMKGELHKKLESDRIDQRLFKSASDIIDALLEQFSPAENITAYPYASTVIQDFLRHAAAHSADISDFIVLHKIKDYLTVLQLENNEQDKNGWDQNGISNCILEIVDILNSRNWKEITYQALQSKDNVTYWNAKLAANKFGIDLWETIWARLQENPLDSSSWYDVTHYSRPEHSDQIIEFALKNLPIEELSTGVKDALGLGVDFSKHACIEYVAIFLENYPGRGERIILASLNSPVTRNRNMALRTLEKWKMENWSQDIESAVRNLKELEPNESVKENIDRLLNGQELQ